MTLGRGDPAVGAMILADHMGSTADRFLFPGFVLAAGVLAAVFGVRLWRRCWVVVDTPTSACGAVFVGRNEVTGRARPHILLTAPVTGRPCVWFRWRLERYVEGNGTGHWQTVEERASSAPFWLVDGTGGVLVRPRGAEVDASPALEERAHKTGFPFSQRDLRTASFQGEDPEERARSQACREPRPASPTPIGQLGRYYRITEWHIGPGQDLYLLGPASLRRDAAALELADHHGPGGLLISTRSEAKVARASLGRAIVGLLLGLVAVVLTPAVFRLLAIEAPDHSSSPAADDYPDMWWALTTFGAVAGGLWSYYRLLRSPQVGVGRVCLAFALTAGWPLGYAALHYTNLAETSRSPWDVAGWEMVLAGLAYLVFVTGLYWTRLYNRLVVVKQQAAAAWSLIDVALRRRHDLLPRLATVTRQYAAHEREIAQALAGLRLDQAPSTSGALPSDATLGAAVELDHRETRGAHALLALSEAYPMLRADAVFQDLARRMTQVEDQVAYARRFYNDAVTVLRDRRSTFPGILVAPFVTSPSWNLFTAVPEERSPVTVVPAGAQVG